MYKIYSIYIHPSPLPQTFPTPLSSSYLFSLQPLNSLSASHMNACVGPSTAVWAKCESRLHEENQLSHLQQPSTVSNSLYRGRTMIPSSMHVEILSGFV